MMRVPTMYVQIEDWRLLKEVISRAAKKFGECSWIGIGYEIDDKEQENAFHVERIEFPKQLNTTGSTEFDEDSIALILSEMDEGERIIWHGHSHGNMDSFFSGDDNKLYSDWTKDLTEKFFLMTVHTTKSEGFSQRVCWKGVDFNTTSQIIELLGDEDQTEAAKIVEEKMSKPITSAPLIGYGGFNDWNRQRNEKIRTIAAPKYDPEVLFEEEDDDEDVLADVRGPSNE